MFNNLLFCVTNKQKKKLGGLKIIISLIFHSKELITPSLNSGLHFRPHR